MTQNHPQTVSEAVNQLLSELPIETKNQIKDSTEDDLVDFHFGLGMRIRNEFGLWNIESALFEDSKKVSGRPFLHVHDAIVIIIKALWERLQKYPPPKLLK